jgi:hypothetical protein
MYKLRLTNMSIKTYLSVRGNIPVDLGRLIRCELRECGD